MSDTERLTRLLGGTDTAWLLDRARRRLERGAPLTGPVTLQQATPGQRRAVETLLGRRPGSGASLRVSLDDVDRVLRASGVAPGGLAEAVVLLTGPVDDLAVRREAAEAAWRAAHARLDETLRDRPELAAWRSWLDSTGLPRRLAGDPDDALILLNGLAEVIARLPSPPVQLGTLAAAASGGDAHALDDGRPLATLALSAARALTGLPFAAEKPTAESRRATWAAVGVHLDELSSAVLCLGLPGDTRTPLGTILATSRRAGEPALLTLRQLHRHPAPLASGTVHLCENPVVVAAAADDLGPSCPPLVCVGGRPSQAVWRLLSLLAEGGATFRYHGDFDWGGVSIATAVHTRIGFQPWRFDVLSYLAAPTSAPLVGRPLPTPWDPSLSPAMQNRSLRVEEELVLPLLLKDLREAGHG